MQFSDFSVFMELYNDEHHNIILEHDHDPPKIFQLTYSQSMFPYWPLHNHKPRYISIDLLIPMTGITNNMVFCLSFLSFRIKFSRFTYVLAWISVWVFFIAK
jgi:hypothetical protein